MKKKPLIRWTIGGGCSMTGFDTLRLSIKNAMQLYPECDYLICHNNLSEEAKKYLKTFPVESFDQKSKTYPVEPNKADWLLWPARMRLNAHEIMMDNDVILLKRHPLIDQFFKSKKMFFACESKGENNYGSYKHSVPQGGLSINSGLYGVPPKHNTEEFFVDFYNRYGILEYNHTNAQGVIASLIKSQNYYKIISNKEITINLPKNIKLSSYKYLDELYGIHFAGVNRSNLHKNWSKYLILNQLKLIHGQYLNLKMQWVSIRTSRSGDNKSE